MKRTHTQIGRALKVLESNTKMVKGGGVVVLGFQKQSELFNMLLYLDSVKR